MLFVLQQSDMEESSTDNVERLNEISESRFDFFILDFIVDAFNLQLPSLMLHINGLHWFTIILKCEACEERRVGENSRFNGLAQTLAIQTAVQYIEIRQIVKSLACMLCTGYIETILYIQ